MPDYMIFQWFPLVENSLRSSQEFLKLSVECALNKLGDLEVSLSVIYWVTEVVRTRKVPFPEINRRNCLLLTLDTEV